MTFYMDTGIGAFPEEYEYRFETDRRLHGNHRSQEKSFVSFWCKLSGHADFEEWKRKFSETSHTEWVMKKENTQPVLFVLSRQYLCFHSESSKKVKTKNYINAHCKARMKVVIRYGTKNIVKLNPIMEGGFYCHIIIDLEHTHPLGITNMSLKEATTEVKAICGTQEAFTNYFSAGMDPFAALDHHINVLKSRYQRFGCLEKMLTNTAVCPPLQRINKWYNNYTFIVKKNAQSARPILLPPRPPPRRRANPADKYKRKKPVNHLTFREFIKRSKSEANLGIGVIRRGRRPKTVTESSPAIPEVTKPSRTSKNKRAKQDPNLKKISSVPSTSTEIKLENSGLNSKLSGEAFTPLNVEKQKRGRPRKIRVEKDETVPANCSQTQANDNQNQAQSQNTEIPVKRKVGRPRTRIIIKSGRPRGRPRKNISTEQTPTSNGLSRRRRKRRQHIILKKEEIIESLLPVVMNSGIELPESDCVKGEIEVETCEEIRIENGEMNENDHAITDSSDILKEILAAPIEKAVITVNSTRTMEENPLAELIEDPISPEQEIEPKNLCNFENIEGKNDEKDVEKEIKEELQTNENENADPTPSLSPPPPLLSDDSEEIEDCAGTDSSIFELEPPQLPGQADQTESPGGEISGEAPPLLNRELEDEDMCPAEKPPDLDVHQNDLEDETEKADDPLTSSSLKDDEMDGPPVLDTMQEQVDDLPPPPLLNAME